MSRSLWSTSIAVVAIVLLLALAACQGASTQAPATDTVLATATVPVTATVSAADAVPATETVAASQATATMPTTSTLAAGAASQPAVAPAASTPLHFKIVPEGTEARFLIDEVLMGQSNTVVGATSGVTGDITVDPANPAAAEVGEIRIDASSLATDDNRRNGRIRNDILKSATAQYQNIVFQPTAITGMPSSVAAGEPFTFQLTGNLTILDTTAPVTFDMTVTPTSTSQLTGSGKATIRYADFGISIPRVPMVADVSDEVQLEIDFTAQAGA